MTITDTAMRAAAELEMDVQITGLLGVYSDPGTVSAHRDGEVRQEFIVCFRGEGFPERGVDES